MLIQIFDDPITLGLAQAGVTVALALVVILIAHRQSIHIERETIIALLRGLIQIVVVGSVLLLLLQGPLWTPVVILLAMIIAAASIAAQRARDIPEAFRVSLIGIGLGAGSTIVLMAVLGVIEVSIASLIPVGSMLIANAMNANALALERFRSDVEANVGSIEAGLALGADPKVTVMPYARSAVRASLIPRIDSLRSLGIVWIPGLMAGMVLSGVDPIYAAIYQFALITMLFAAAGLTSLISTALIRTHAFSRAEQLILRPDDSAALEG